MAPEKGKNHRFGEKHKAKFKPGSRVRQISDGETAPEDEPEEDTEIKNLQPETIFMIQEGDFDDWHGSMVEDPWAGLVPSPSIRQPAQSEAALERRHFMAVPPPPPPSPVAAVATPPPPPPPPAPSPTAGASQQEVLASMRQVCRELLPTMLRDALQQLLRDGLEGRLRKYAEDRVDSQLEAEIRARAIALIQEELHRQREG